MQKWKSCDRITIKINQWPQGLGSLKQIPLKYNLFLYLTIQQHSYKNFTSSNHVMLNKTQINVKYVSAVSVGESPDAVDKM